MAKSQFSMAGTQPEPWMRGPIKGVSPFMAPVLYSFQQAKEDLTKHTANLDTVQVWARPHGFAPLGFHLRHIAGSIDRLTAYLQNLPLSAEQFDALDHEMTPGATLEELLTGLDQSIHSTVHVVSNLDETRLAEPRTVGRKQLPSTVIGLLIHIAEHTQRHVGQAISAANLARAFSLIN